MSRSQITAGLSKLLEQHLAKSTERWAREVRIGAPTECRVDYMSIRCQYGALASLGGIEHAEVTCYEVKSCMADYKSGNGLNKLGDINCIVCPDDLRRKLILGTELGVSGWDFAIPCPIGCRSFSKPIKYNGEVDGWRLCFFPAITFGNTRKIPIAQAVWAILCGQKGV
ncbi:MAG: hypothetical protein RR842_04065 [Gordonibacter sp.]|uniref:hypothetical protein n=1 Tax=Gordonibacter sp. TaxID=1968902 RepID=UPI002FC70EF3